MVRLSRLPATAAALAFSFCLVATPLTAQQMPAVRDNATPPVSAGEIQLKTTSPALAKDPESWMQIGKSFVAHNVSTPTLTPYLPPAGKANGTAVVIAPGGGFMILSMTSEGSDVARWLASKGITAFVLKYRLTPTPPTFAALMATMTGRLGPKDKFESTPWFADGTRIATEDAMEAMRVVRANAAKWKVDPHKVGFMGFSAGAYTTLSLVNKNDVATKPDFIAPIYGSLGTPASPLPPSLPPMWTSMAADDPIVGKTDFGLLNAWRANGGAVEFHLYDKGGHGYGFAGTPGTTTVAWPGEFLAWLQSRGLYTPPSGQ